MPTFRNEKTKPGPWKFQMDHLNDVWLLAADGTEVCRFACRDGYAPSATTGVTRPPTHADAALIADAPAMLELLEKIGRDLDLVGSHGEHLKSILALLDKHGRST